MSHGADEPGTGPGSQPLLTVIRGEVTAAELAAVTVVIGALTGRAGQSPAAGHTRSSSWAAKGRALRPQLHPGPGAWRASALPR
jgi:hypothetical protein